MLEVSRICTREHPCNGTRGRVSKKATAEYKISVENSYRIMSSEKAGRANGTFEELPMTRRALDPGQPLNACIGGRHYEGRDGASAGPQGRKIHVPAQGLPTGGSRNGAWAGNTWGGLDSQRGWAPPPVPESTGLVPRLGWGDICTPNKLPGGARAHAENWSQPRSPMASTALSSLCRVIYLVHDTVVRRVEERST